MRYLNKYNLLSRNQFGFSKNVSIELAVFSLTNEIGRKGGL